MIAELGKYVPMEPRRSYPVVIVTPERIAALEAEVAREHEAACALALAVGDIGEILGVQVTIAECAETKQAARRIVAEVARLREAGKDALGTIELLDLGTIDDPIVYTLVVNTRFFLRAALGPTP